jgi:hypothetical protein
MRNFTSSALQSNERPVVVFGGKAWNVETSQKLLVYASAGLHILIVHSLSVSKSCFRCEDVSVLFSNRLEESMCLRICCFKTRW